MVRIILAFALLRATVFSLPNPESDNPAVSGRGPASPGSELSAEESISAEENEYYNLLRDRIHDENDDFRMSKDDAELTYKVLKISWQRGTIVSCMVYYLKTIIYHDITHGTELAGADPLVERFARPNTFEWLLNGTMYELDSCEPQNLTAFIEQYPSNEEHLRKHCRLVFEFMGRLIEGIIAAAPKGREVSELERRLVKRRDDIIAVIQRTTGVEKDGAVERNRDFLGLIEESLTWPERAPLLDLEPDEANSTRVYILLDVFKAESSAPRQANSSDEVGDYYFDNAEL